MASRRIIQLVTDPATKHTSGLLYALADDGTVWYIIHGNGGPNEQWQQKPALPAPIPHKPPPSSNDRL